MPEANQESNRDAKEIVDGILDDAREEAEKIRSEARSRVEDRRMLLNGRVQRVKDDAASEAKKRVEEINRRTDAEIGRAQRRNELARRRDVLAAVQKRVRARLVEMSREGTEDYRRALGGWIVEGALGLAGTEVEVSVAAWENELLASAIAEAKQRIDELVGTEVALRAGESHGGSPGPVVSTPDERTIYDNRIDARIRRHENAIRRMVYEIMFPEHGDSGDESGDGG